METPTTDTSITTIVRHFIKADKTQAFENWSKEVAAIIAKQFEGFEGLQLVHPPKGHTDYLVLFKFSSFQTLEKWMNSNERANEVKKLDELSKREMILGEVNGIDFWFKSPGATKASTPPKWKMALLTWVAVFPGVVILSKIYHLIFPMFPALLIVFLVTISLVPLLTWVLMPNIVKMAKRWLFQSSD